MLIRLHILNMTISYRNFMQILLGSRISIYTYTFIRIQLIKFSTFKFIKFSINYILKLDHIHNINRCGLKFFHNKAILLWILSYHTQKVLWSFGFSNSFNYIRDQGINFIFNIRQKHINILIHYSKNTIGFVQL